MPWLRYFSRYRFVAVQYLLANCQRTPTRYKYTWLQVRRSCGGCCCRHSSPPRNHRSKSKMTRKRDRRYRYVPHGQHNYGKMATFVSGIKPAHMIVQVKLFSFCLWKKKTMEDCWLVVGRVIPVSKNYVGWAAGSIRGRALKRSGNRANIGISTHHVLVVGLKTLVECAERLHSGRPWLSRCISSTKASWLGLEDW